MPWLKTVGCECPGCGTEPCDPGCDCIWDYGLNACDDIEEFFLVDNCFYHDRDLSIDFDVALFTGNTAAAEIYIDGSLAYSTGCIAGGTSISDVITIPAGTTDLSVRTYTCATDEECGYGVEIHLI
jgi:hypothetical protein